MQVQSGEKVRGRRMAGQNQKWSTSHYPPSQVAQKTGEGGNALVSQSLPPNPSCCSSVNWRRRGVKADFCGLLQGSLKKHMRVFSLSSDVIAMQIVQTLDDNFYVLWYSPREKRIKSHLS